MADGQLHCEALASAHAAVALTRAHATLLEMIKTGPENSLIYGALFSSVCNLYHTAFETQNHKGKIFTPSPKAGEGHDRDIHKFLVLFRKKLSAHHDSKFHNTRLLWLIGQAVDEQGNRVQDLTVPVISQTTILAPVSDKFIQRILVHVYSLATHYEIRSRSLLRMMAASMTVDNIMSEPGAKEYGRGEGVFEASEDSSTGARRVAINVPTQYLRTPPPMRNADGENFLRMSTQVFGHDGSMDHTIGASFEVMPLDEVDGE